MNENDVIEKLKIWFNDVYKKENHIACLELPILKIIVENDKSLTREEIIDKLKIYGDFEEENYLLTICGRKDLVKVKKKRF